MDKPLLSKHRLNHSAVLSSRIRGCSACHCSAASSVAKYGKQWLVISCTAHLAAAFDVWVVDWLILLSQCLLQVRLHTVFKGLACVSRLKFETHDLQQCVQE